jgi:tetratricopeptide (TPR) repeat protein
MIVNLLLPAWHVVTSFRTPIYYLHVQLAELGKPVTDDTAERHNATGLALLQSQQIEEAIKAFDRALDVQPSHAAARFNRASANLTRGRFEEARKDLTQVIRQGEDLLNAHFLRGFCHERLGDRQAAAADYQAALRLAPPDWPARSEAAQRLESLRKQ